MKTSDFYYDLPKELIAQGSVGRQVPPDFCTFPCKMDL